MKTTNLLLNYLQGSLYYDDNYLEYDDLEYDDQYYDDQFEEQETDDFNQTKNHSEPYFKHIHIDTQSELEKGCSICLDEDAELVSLPLCEHKFCKECLSQYLRNKINDIYTQLRHDRVALVREDFYLILENVIRVGVLCPQQGCIRVLGDGLINQFVDEETKEIYKYSVLRQTVQSIEGVKPCPFGCGGFIQNECLCINPDCREIILKLRKFKLDYEGTYGFHFANWSKTSDSRLCPNCQAQIEKNGGCDHMYCIYCNRPFLWSNAQRFGTGHNWWKPVEKIKIKDEAFAKLFEIANRAEII